MTVAFGYVLGATVRGLNVLPDGLHIVYPLGCKVVVQNWKTKRQVFLSGHTNLVSTVAVSPDGKYIASGQINHMGFKVSTLMYYTVRNWDSSVSIVGTHNSPYTK
jgi:WD40 repeat protein